MNKKISFNSNNPINNPEEDFFNFEHFAQKIKKIIQGYSYNSEPLTIGIYGKWGSGKTSLLRLIEKDIELFKKNKDDKPFIKFHYNPWLYQSKEEMLFDFFDTLSRKLNYTDDEQLKKAGKLIKKYSRYLKAVKLSASVGIPKVFNAGISIEPYEILQRLGEDLEGNEKSLDDLKNEVNHSLDQSSKKIIIFIDDVDRLDKDEIFTLFKLIKVNADFKNLVFLVCLDPDYVAKAIHSRYGSKKQSGIDFLEKIINIPLELPLIEKSDLDYFVKEKVKSILDNKFIDEDNKNELIYSLRGDYFNSPREIIRILNSFAVSYFAIGEEVNLHDLFWIEYLKIKYFKAYQMIKNYAHNLESNFPFVETIDFNDFLSENKNESGLRMELSKMRKAYKVIDFLFPMNRNGTIISFQNQRLKPLHILDSELRINHVDHFEKYFSFHTKGKISEITFSKLLSDINQDFTEKSLSLFKNLKSNVEERKVVYRFKTEIEKVADKSNNKLLIFLAKNINTFSSIENSEGGFDIEIVRSIAKRLITDPTQDENYILKIASYFNSSQLTYFIDIIKQGGNISLLKKLEINLIHDIKKEGEQFYKRKYVAHLILKIWSENNHKELEDYLISSFFNKDNIYSFFKIFPHFWNEKIYGAFRQDNYIYLTKRLKQNGQRFYHKIKSIIPELNNINSLDDIDLEWDDYKDNSGLDHSKQFIYWHLKNMKNE
ncbi:KAP family P-loop NTPase fold protein [Zunongwangia sp. HGR-M22]|uniref:KAP family P-loop NTPase fold protein n=1 Tax=Zunongwangia sp. HGR-M22 TaxID=3015168 RepID=UPI0022DDC433|nr:P-loop NTPase fold protein [Zunongwangia sp. HGR-M22]WBL26775.1 P-loop NTPase fold protein [Zunongwangia sp. HGR-M22]